MYREVVYWTYYICSKNKGLRKDGQVSIVALFWSALPLFLNFLPLIWLADHFILGDIIKTSFPTEDHSLSLVGQIIALLFIGPFLIFTWKRYFSHGIIDKIVDIYSKKSRKRRFWGFVAYVAYYLFSFYFLAYFYLNIIP